MSRKQAFVFPGQGSQVVGMGRHFADAVPEASDVFDVAGRLTGIPVRRLCFDGPMEELTETRNLQTCLAAVEIATLLAVRKAGLEPDAVAGHSLGECVALFAAGVLDLEKTILLVLERGRLMDEAAKARPGAMAAILGLSREDLDDMIRPLSERGVIALANHNSPEQIVATGERPLVEELCGIVKERGKKGIMLKVSGAYHSPLMKDAAESFRQVLEGIDFRPARVPVYSNVSAGPESDPVRIRDLLYRQISSPVRWYEISRAMYRDGISSFIEIGPKNVLANLLRKSLPEGKCRIFSVGDPGGLEACRGGIPG